jgi:hypothetical protein
MSGFQKNGLSIVEELKGIRVAKGCPGYIL